MAALKLKMTQKKNLKQWLQKVAKRLKYVSHGDKHGVLKNVFLQLTHFLYPKLRINLGYLQYSWTPFRYTVSTGCGKRISSLCTHIILHMRMSQICLYETGCSGRYRIKNLMCNVSWGRHFKGFDIFCLVCSAIWSKKKISALFEALMTLAGR